VSDWQIYKGVVRQGQIHLTPPVDLPEGSTVYVVMMGQPVGETAVSQDDDLSLVVTAVEEYIRRSSPPSPPV
jgi:hypothetical protein